MALNVIIISIILYGILNTIQGAIIEPGCSFVGDQCIYSIKLGHKNQCDSITPSSTTTAGANCCSDVTHIKDEMEKLKVQMDVIKSSLTTGASPSDIEASLKKALADRDDILAVLNRKETELNDTKKELSEVMGKAATEIQQLREDLKKAQNSVISCQKVLGGATSVNPVSSLRDTDYELTYYSFNDGYGDFTLSSYMKLYSSSSYGSPRVEHSWGVRQGRYLGISGNQIAPNSYRSSSVKTANAVSGKFPPADAYCIMYWYYMEGTDVQALSLNVKINGGEGYPVFTTKGAKNTHQWQLAQIELDSEWTSHEFQIDFAMTSNAYYSYSSSQKRNYNTKGDIAVDDLYVYNTTCNNVRRHPLGAYSYATGNITSYYTFHATPMSWTEAYDVCRRESPWSALVSIETEQEQKFLVNLIQHDVGLNALGQKGFYTSGTDVDAEHVFIWTNTGISRPIKQNSWHPGQPNNVAGDQDCLLLEYAGSNYEWGDVDCDLKHPFICEVEVSN